VDDEDFWPSRESESESCVSKEGRITTTDHRRRRRHRPTQLPRYTNVSFPSLDLPSPRVFSNSRSPTHVLRVVAAILEGGKSGSARQSIRRTKRNRASYLGSPDRLTWSIRFLDHLGPVHHTSRAGFRITNTTCGSDIFERTVPCFVDVVTLVDST
jgi:hypothetical protein